jgi:hypothetical protein
MKNNRLYKYSLIFFFCLLGYAQLERIQVNPQIAFYLHEIFMILWIIVVFLKEKSIRTSFVSSTTRLLQRTWPIGIWLLLGWGNVFLRGENLGIPILYTLRLLTYLGFLFILFRLVKEKQLKVRDLAELFLIPGIMFLCFGLYQYFYLPDVKFLQVLGWDDHFNRLISTLFDPGFTGILFVICFYLVQLFSSFGKKKNHLQNMLCVTLSLGFAYGLLLTYSRASFLAFGISLLLGGGILLLKRQWKAGIMLGGILLMFVASVPFLPRTGGEGVKLERSSTIIARSEAAQSVVQSVRKWEWVWGRGIFVPIERPSSGFYQVPDHGRLQDNWVVFFLTDTGVVGLLAAIFFLGKYVLWSIRHNVWLSCAAVAVFVHGLFNASLFYPLVVLYLGGMTIVVLLSKADRQY